MGSIVPPNHKPYEIATALIFAVALSIYCRAISLSTQRHLQQYIHYTVLDYTGYKLSDKFYVDI